MAGSDDVSRDVASLMFEEIIKFINMNRGVLPLLFRGAQDTADQAVSQMLDKINKNMALKEMLGIEGEISVEELSQIIRQTSEEYSSVEISDSDAKEFDDLLKEKGVLYAKTEWQDDDCKLYIFLNKDLDKVNAATQMLSARSGHVTELNSKLYFNGLSPDQVHVVEGLSEVEMELFRHYARKQGLLYTSIPRKDGDMVVCGVEDTQKARKALLYAGWALTGAEGARVREQVERRLAGRTAINIAAEEGDRELYIVSRTNPGQYVHISAEDYAVYKRDKQVSTVSRTDPDFYAKCISACEGLEHPVVMSAQQYHANITPQEMEKAHTIDLFPEAHDDREQMNRVNSLVDLVAQKSGLDNEHNATWGLWDPSVSYSEFASYEYIMDEDERDARQKEFDHFRNAAFYSQNNHTAYDVDMKEKNLDYIIAKAEEKRRQQSGEPSREQEHSYGFGL